MGKRGAAPSQRGGKRQAASPSQREAPGPGRSGRRRCATTAAVVAQKLRDNYSGFTEYECDVKTVQHEGAMLTLRSRLEMDVEVAKEGKLKFGPHYHRDLKVAYKEESHTSKELGGMAP
eukprot:10613895-Lingulodinium_polyedra.AAC.1